MIKNFDELIDSMSKNCSRATDVFPSHALLEDRYELMSTTSFVESLNEYYQFIKGMLLALLFTSFINREEYDVLDSLLSDYRRVNYSRVIGLYKVE